MFGKMTISSALQVNPNNQPEIAVAALLELAEQEIVRSVEFPYSVLLFVIAEIGIMQREERADKQAGSNSEHEGDSDLSDVIIELDLLLVAIEVDAFV